MKIPGEDLLCPFCRSDELCSAIMTNVSGASIHAISCVPCGATWAPIGDQLTFACVRGPRQVTIVGELAQPEIESGDQRAHEPRELP